MQFQRIDDNADLFSAFEEADALSSRFDYDGLAANLNTTPVGQRLVFPYDKAKAAMLKAQLEKRGLIASVDYSIKFIPDPNSTEEGATLAGILRTSEKQSVKVTAKARGRRKSKEEPASEANGEVAE